LPDERELSYPPRVQNENAPAEPEAKESPPVTAVETKPEAVEPRESPRMPDIDPARLDADAVRVVARLRQHGHEAYLVGGCVRDLLLNRSPKDFDIATSATPNQVRELFRNCRLIGRRFRLAHVYFKGGKILEVSTFRANPTQEEPQPSEAAEGEVHSEDAADMAVVDLDGVATVEKADDDAEVALEAAEDLQALEGDDDDDDGEEGDELAGDAEAELTPPELPAPAAAATPANGNPNGPAPRDVFIDEDNTFGTAIQDALRRDFTINAMFYDPMAGQVIDHTRGLRDLAAREMRTIGDPEVRLREDPVRILRAVRFACKLGFDFEPRTYAAMEGAVEDLPRCSAPRLLEETFRLIRGGTARDSLKLLRALDALKLLVPPIDEHLRNADAEGVEEFFSFAEALDAQIAEGQVFDDSQVLACILLPLALATPEPPLGSDGRLQVATGIEKLLSELVRTSRLPRRIAERCRMILLAQKTLSGQRRRRGGLASFRRHPLFSEALKVFEVWVLATGERYHELELWKSGGAPEPTGDAQGPGRRRRRRRRGGKGGNGGGGGEAPPSGAAGAP